MAVLVSSDCSTLADANRSSEYCSKSFHVVSTHEAPRSFFGTGFWANESLSSTSSQAFDSSHGQPKLLSLGELLANEYARSSVHQGILDEEIEMRSFKRVHFLTLEQLEDVGKDLLSILDPGDMTRVTSFLSTPDDAFLSE
jgi:hypothetical protein